MTSVDRLQGMVSQIRTTLARRSDKTTSGAGTRSTGRGAQAQAQLTLDELRAGLRSGLVGLALDQSDDRKRARRLFIESVLLSEFGIQLANDARFATVVNRVESVFSDDELVLGELDAVLAEVQQGS